MKSENIMIKINGNKWKTQLKIQFAIHFQNCQKKNKKKSVVFTNNFGSCGCQNNSKKIQKNVQYKTVIYKQGNLNVNR